MAPEPQLPPNPQNFAESNSQANTWITVGEVNGADGDKHKSAGWAGYADSRTSSYADAAGAITNQAAYATSGSVVEAGHPQQGYLSRQLTGRPSNYHPGASIDQILDFGKGGLEFFKLLFEHYKDTFGHYPCEGRCPARQPSKDEKCMEDAYFMQKGMKLDRLETVGCAVNLAPLQQAKTDQQQATAALNGHWHGGAANSAQITLDGLAALVADDMADVAQIPTLVARVVDNIKLCVQRKANAFHELVDVKFVNGISMTNGDTNDRGGDDDASDNDDVTMIMRFAQRRGIGDNARKRIGILFPGLPKYDTSGDSSDVDGTNKQLGKTHFDDAAQRLCTQWVEQFRQSVDGYVEAFYTLCRQTDTAIKSYIDVLVTLLDRIGQRPYPKPEVNAPAPNSTAPNAPGATPGSTTAAGTTPPIQRAPLKTAPPTTAPGADPLAAVTNIASQAGQVVQQGVGQLAADMKQAGAQFGASAEEAVRGRPHMPDQTQQPAPPSDIPRVGLPHVAAPPISRPHPGSRVLCHIAVPGGQATLTQTQEGRVELDVTGPDGIPHAYTIDIKDGLPYFTVDAARPADVPVPSDPSAHGVAAAASEPHTDHHTNSQDDGTVGPSPSENTYASGAYEHDTSTGAMIADGPAASGSVPMGGMPTGGMTQAGRSSGDTERRSSGIVKPAPLWGELPGRRSSTLDAPAPAKTTEALQSRTIDWAQVDNPGPSPAPERAAPPPPPTGNLQVKISLADPK